MSTNYESQLEEGPEPEEMFLRSVAFPDLYNSIDTRGEGFLVFPTGSWGDPTEVGTAAEALEKAEEFLRAQIDTEVSRIEKLDALSALRPVKPRPPEEPVPGDEDEEEGDGGA